MRRNLVFLFFALTATPLAILAQQQTTPAPAAQLTDQQVEGRRIFRQRCGVCHTSPTPGARIYGPVLYKQLIVGNEDGIREFIRNGSPGRMPGFQYGLESTEINDIIEFLKTVEKPRPAQNSNASDVPMD
jgi:mono/diheme cytochrome c family protein